VGILELRFWICLWAAAATSVLAPVSSLAYVCRFALRVLLRAAEEFALHKIISMAEDFCTDGNKDEIVAEPRSTLDEDFDLVSELAFLDHDVLMLYDMPHVSHVDIYEL
jgi:hypothetical protein